MSILLSLSPFAVFFALMRARSPLAGLAGAFFASLLLCLRMLWRGEALKILEAGSLVVFGALGAATLWLAPRCTVATVRLAVDAGLLGIVLASLAVGRPFTLQYARERVPRQFWHLPVFLTTNRRITTAWAAAFAIMVLADLAGEYAAAVPLWVDVAASIAAFVGAVWFTRWYPAAVQRRFAAAALAIALAAVAVTAAPAPRLALEGPGERATTAWADQSLGSPRTRSPRMLRRISVVPARMPLPRARSA